MARGLFADPLHRRAGRHQVCQLRSGPYPSACCALARPTRV